MTTRKERARKLGIPEDQLPYDRRGTHGNTPKGEKCHRWNKGKIISSHGYTKVRVDKNDQLSDPNGYAYEHHIVWREAGNEHPKKGQVIHHKNDDKQDNHIENLKLITRRHHALEHGQAIFTDAQIISIRERYSNGEQMKTIAIEFGVPHQRISKIINRKVYADVGLTDGTSSHVEWKKKSGNILDGETYSDLPEEAFDQDIKNSIEDGSFSAAFPGIK